MPQRVMQGRRVLRTSLFVIGFLAAMLTGVHIGSRRLIESQIDLMEPGQGEWIEQLLGIQTWLGGVILLCLLVIGFALIRPLADDLDERTEELNLLRAKQQARDGPDDGTLPGIASLHELLMHDLARARRHGQALGLLRISIQELSKQPEAERLREGITRTLRNTVRSSDYAAESGVDEIALVVPIIRTVEGLGVLADRLTAALSIYLRGKGNPETPIRIGIAVAWPSGEQDAELLLVHAGEALEEAKASDDTRNWHYHASAVQGLTEKLRLAKG